MDDSIVKNGEVEVTSEEEERVWYRAILEDDPKKSVHEKLRVRYLTLLNDDGSAPLTVMVDRRFIRPVPPENPYDCVILKEGSVVDADLKGGWCVGLLIKKIEDDQKYLVYFDFPPDIIQFERRQLKAHLDWTGSKWVRPEITELVRSGFSSGTMVELREDLAWREVMIVKELEDEKRFIVKNCDNSFSCCNGESSENETVDSLRVRPMQPHFSVRNYELLDRVEAFSGFVWRQGVVKEILCDGRYIISFGEETKEELHFNRADLRPQMEWKDGAWHKRTKVKSEKETPSDGKRNQTVASETIDEMADDGDVIATPVKHEKARGKTSNEKTVEPVTNQSGLGNESTREKICEEHNSRKRKTKSEDTTTVLPFTKELPIWKIYESMEVLKRVPQTPHFSPLLKSKEDFREGCALGVMAVFTSLLEKVKALKTDVPISRLESLKESFSELVKHGFDVAAPLSRIDKLLATKDGQLNILEEVKGFEKEIMDESSEMRKADEEFDEMELKILELRKQQEVRKERKELAYKKICQKKSCVRDLGVKLKDLESEFETISSAPW